jgi:hypothetical protein
VQLIFYAEYCFDPNGCLLCTKVQVYVPHLPALISDGDHSIFPKFATYIHTTFLRRKECYRFTSNQNKGSTLHIICIFTILYVVTFYLFLSTSACVASMIFASLSVYHLYDSTSNATRKTQQCAVIHWTISATHPSTNRNTITIYIL